MQKRIMIVDDDTDMLKLLGMILSRHGYEIIPEARSTAVINRIQEQRPDLFILDVMMPDIDGIELCKMLRADDASTPIIFLSAKVDQKSVDAGMAAGGNIFLPKTSLTGDLVNAIKRFLDAHVCAIAD